MNYKGKLNAICFNKYINWVKLKFILEDFCIQQYNQEFVQDDKKKTAFKMHQKSRQHCLADYVYVALSSSTKLYLDCQGT